MRRRVVFPEGFCEAWPELFVVGDVEAGSSSRGAVSRSHAYAALFQFVEHLIHSQGLSRLLAEVVGDRFAGFVSAVLSADDKQRTS
ncbi:MAG: hypothetical protein QM630_00100 [Microbacterium sp.]